MKHTIWHPIKSILEKIRLIFHEEFIVLQEEIKAQNNTISDLQKDNILLRDKINELIYKSELQNRKNFEIGEKTSMHLEDALTQNAQSIMMLIEKNEVEYMKQMKESSDVLCELSKSTQALRNQLNEMFAVLQEEIETQNNAISDLQKDNILLRDKINELIHESELQNKKNFEIGEKISMHLEDALTQNAQSIITLIKKNEAGYKKQMKESSDVLYELSNITQASRNQLNEIQSIILNNSDYSKTLVRLTTEEVNKIMRADRKNLTNQLTRITAMQTANFILRNMPKTKKFSKVEELWSYALAITDLEGLYIEFGVYSGKSINYLSNVKKEEIFYGFDSFEGLPEDWRTDYGKGTFKCDMPTVNENVILIKGYFDETLPVFVKEHLEDCAFIHVDCDLYSSAKVVFDCLKDRIKAGTIILFDEYFNYPNWQQGEYKAFQEFVAENNVKYEYVAYRDVHEQVLVRILGIGN